MPPSSRRASLAQRGLELSKLGWPGAQVQFRQGKELRFVFSVSPTLMGRSYRCMLRVPRSGYPSMVVLEPDLKSLAGDRCIPHTYMHQGKGTELCLWLPRELQWNSGMRLSETYLPWTAEWLDYFEEWLETDSWAGGGAHPEARPSPRSGRVAQRGCRTHR